MKTGLTSSSASAGPDLKESDVKRRPICVRAIRVSMEADADPTSTLTLATAQKVSTATIVKRMSTTANLRRAKMADHA